MDGEVIRLVANGLTANEVQAYLAEAYGERVSRAAIGAITGGALEEMAEWRSRPLDRVYAVLFLDATWVKVADSRMVEQPVYVALGVAADGRRDVLGLWAGAPGGEGADDCLQILTEIRQRGTDDVLIAVCDGLPGFSEAVSRVWPAAVTETCTLQLLRESYLYASKRDWTDIAVDLKLVYTAPHEAEALARFEDFSHTWAGEYPAIVHLWEGAWPGFVPFLAFDPDVRGVIIATANAMDRLNARIRRAVEANGYFPTGQVALRLLYLVVISSNFTDPGRQQRSRGWDAAFDAFNATFEDRLMTASNESAGLGWKKVAVGVAIVLAIGSWDFAVYGRHMQPPGHGARPSASAAARPPGRGSHGESARPSSGRPLPVHQLR